MLFSRKRPKFKLPTIKLGNNNLSQVFSHKHLGLILTPNLSWNEHILDLISRANKRLARMKSFKYRISRDALKTCYFSFIRPVLEYGDIIYDACSNEMGDKLEAVQIEAAQTITGAKRRSSHEGLYKELGLNTLKHRRQLHKLKKMFDITNNLTPKYLHNLTDNSSVRNLRGSSNGNLKPDKFNTQLYSRSFFIAGVKSWNDLPSSIKLTKSEYQFKKHIASSSRIIANIFDNSLPRKSQIIIAQLRIGFSDLNYDLFNKGCTDTPNCDCGHAREDVSHFIFSCPLFSNQRQTLLTNINNLHLNAPLNVKTLLYSHKNLTSDQYCKLLHLLSKYFVNTNRLLDYIR